MFASVIGVVVLALSSAPPPQIEIAAAEPAASARAIDGPRQPADDQGQSEQRTVRAYVQPRPGGPTELIDMRVHPSPVDPPSIDGAAANLTDDELVLGLVVDGQPMAYPIRYLAPYEVLNDVVGSTALAPTW